MAASQTQSMYPSFNIFTWGSCRFGEVEILYPNRLALSKVTKKEGKHILDLGAIVIEYDNHDSRKNLHRDVRIVEVREPVVVRYYGRSSCSHGFDEVWVIDRDGARQVDLRSRVVTKENGKYRYTIQQYYVEFDGKEIVVKEDIIEKQPIMEKLEVRARVDGNKIIVSGDTFHVRDVLKALKFRWDWKTKTWYNECADEADVGYTLMELEAQLREKGVNLVVEGREG